MPKKVKKQRRKRNMITEQLSSHRGTPLRKNKDIPLVIKLNSSKLTDIFLINGSQFLTRNILPEDLEIAPHTHYMIINRSDEELQLKFSKDFTDHTIVYDPYKYEDSNFPKINPDEFKKVHDIPEGYIDILPKWYSIKFTYPDFNLIFIRPQLGISFQIHQERSEYWEIVKGKPIVISGTHVYYYVKSGTHIENPVGNYHSIINPNTKSDQFVVIKERWSGHFDEEDIERVFNPNHYK
ncbi:MAG: Mannose-6-phosphate isomerase [Promethearchaeota archaeon]|nr:MAG: Mannose-6-phosphate isomerase [Candidatus Lokiarchaeota archaeon]